MAEQHCFKLHELQIDPTTGDVAGPNRRLRLEPKPMAVLMTLARQPGQVVSRQQLLDSVWPGVVVGEEAVTRCISELRDALGDDRQTPRFIRTLPKRGYVLLVHPDEMARAATHEAEHTGVAPGVAGRNTATSVWPVTIVCGALLLAVLLARLLLPPASTAEHPLRLAVLPFAEPGSSNRYFGEGFAEQVLDTLARAPGLAVAARGVSFPRPVPETEAAAVGLRLRADAVLVGRVQRSAAALQLDVRLLDTHSGRTRFVRHYARAPIDVFLLQDEIANDVTRALGIDTTTPLRAARVSSDVDAYDLYLLGRYHWNQRTDASLARARTFFQRSLEVDAHNALAYSGLADCELLLANLDIGDRAQHQQAARRAIERALAIDPMLTEAHASLGLWHMELGHAAQADREFQYATRRNARYAMAWMWWAINSTYQGHARDAYYQASIAARLEPSNPTPLLNLMSASNALGRSAETRSQGKSLAALDATHLHIASVMFWLALDMGDADETARIAAVVQANPDGHGIGELMRARIAERAQDSAATRRWLLRADARMQSDTAYEIQTNWLDVLAFAGDVEGVRAHLQQLPPALVTAIAKNPAHAWPPPGAWLGIALAQSRRFDAALPLLLDEVQTPHTADLDVLPRLINESFAVRACVEVALPACASVRAAAQNRSDLLRANGWHNATYLMCAGMLHAALSQADLALADLREAARLGKLDAAMFSRDVRLDPIRELPAVRTWLATLPKPIAAASTRIDPR